VWGCVLALVLYAVLWRADARLATQLPITRVLAAISYGLIGIIGGRLLATYYYDRSD
jgi:hypothetical protein